MKNAIVLCSGGIDSVTVAYFVKNRLKYENIHIIFFDYGQKCKMHELNSCRYFAKELSAKFEEVKLDFLSKISTSNINLDNKINKIKRKDLKNTKNEAENFYVPLRNLVFLSNALSYSEAIYMKEKNLYDIFVGFKEEGEENYPDTSKSFVDEINKLSKISSFSKSRIIAPFIKKDKEDIIRLGTKMKIDFSKTFSCYNKFKVHCGYCLSCRLRQEAFYWANISDTTKYLYKMKDFRKTI